MKVNDIIKENLRRLAAINEPYDPNTGEGSFSTPRTKVEIDGCPLHTMWLPDDFVKTPFVQVLMDIGFNNYIVQCHQEPDESSRQALYVSFCRQRIMYDFEFWAATTAHIESKESGRVIPFILRMPQRILLKEFERLRLAGEPIDIILLKARQWGGSTLTQIYMLWMQLVLHKNWHSVICGDVESQASTITGMLSTVLRYYPSWASLGAQVVSSPFERSQKTRVISTSQSRFSIGSAQKPDSLRSQNIKLAHLSEVGLWKDTKGKKPEDLVQAIFGSVLTGADTMKVLESTAKGVGNYFHRTWLDAVDGKNNFTPVFIAWYQIEMYSKPMERERYKEFIGSLTEYERWLFDQGATLEAIAWYRDKSQEFADDWRFKSEYPSTAQEAFQSTGRRVFPINYVESVRSTCISPVFTGEFIGHADKGNDALQGLHFEPRESKDSDGILNVWFMPDTSVYVRNRYVVSVDVGGVSTAADYSVIKVFDRYPMVEGGVPEVVAEWHGHIEHDLLSWKAAQIAEAYCHALLVIESNTLETDGTEGDNFEYILDEIVYYYDNLYSRTSPEQIKQGMPVRYGFHTNPSTKPTVIGHLRACMRDSLYLERSIATTYEMDTYEVKENGREMGAVEGCHDDYVMSTAIGLYVAYHMDAPAVVTKEQLRVRKRKIVSEASI